MQRLPNVRPSSSVSSSASSSKSAQGPRRGRLFQGALVEFRRTTGAMTRGEVSKVHTNGKYDGIYKVDGKRFVKVNVLGTSLGLLPLVPELRHAL